MERTADTDRQIAIVTGAARGLGCAIAMELFRQGWSVALIDILEEELAVTADEMHPPPDRNDLPQCIGVQCDLTSVTEIRRAVNEVVNTLGRVDLLVNNAGLNIRQPLFDVSESDWDRVLDTNLKSMFFMCQAAGKGMLQRQSGSVINVASILACGGWKAPAGFTEAMYCASKAGVVGLTRALAIEWAPHHVRVNAIAPGFIRTPMTQRIREDPMSVTDIAARTPLARIAEVEDIVGAVIFLSSDAAQYITGHTLMVDGGWSSM